MEKKQIAAKKYIVFETETTLKDLVKVADKETPRLMNEVENLKLKVEAPMEFIYHNCLPDPNHVFKLEIALPINNASSTPNSPYQIVEKPAFNCYSEIHKGSIANIASSYENIMKDLQKNEVQLSNEIREVYEKFEGHESEANITEIQIGCL